jgi:uncharacterized membrane protein SpoIIM required for sporulation
MDLSAFLDQRRAVWKRLEEVLHQVEGSGLATLNDEQAQEFGKLYRRTASDLNQAQTFASGDATVRYLNDLAARAYLLIYGRTRVNVRALLSRLIWGYPAHFRRHFSHFLVAMLIFTAGGVFGFLASLYDGALARSYLLPGMSTIQPRGEGEDDPTQAMSTDELTAFSTRLFANNLGVSLLAFALGMTLGIGTVWVMFFNGILTGVLAAVFWEANSVWVFLTGILPHGVLEIPACLIGGAAGFVLAQGMLRARPWPRLEELARTGKEALWLVWGCVPLLVMAAILEAGVARAPDQILSTGIKLAVAAVGGLLFLTYLLLPLDDQGKWITARVRQTAGA